MQKLLRQAGEYFESLHYTQAPFEHCVYGAIKMVQTLNESLWCTFVAFIAAKHHGTPTHTRPHEIEAINLWLCPRYTESYCHQHYIISSWRFSVMKEKEREKPEASTRHF